MSELQALDNRDRLHRAMIATLAGQTIEFTKKSDFFIVVFRDHLDQFSFGKIVLVQQFFLSNCGHMPEINKIMPSCTKCFFGFSSFEDSLRKQLGILIKSSAFSELCVRLGISYVQFSGKIYFFK